jgi:hypothetical protein
MMLTRRLPLAVLLLGFPAAATAMVATQLSDRPERPAAVAVAPPAPAPAAAPVPRLTPDPRPGFFDAAAPAAAKADKPREKRRERAKAKPGPEPVARYAPAPAPVPVPAPPPPSCADAEAAPAIAPAAAPTLARVWNVEVAEGRAFTGAPVVADGCLYAVTTDGEIIAVNADTGERVWTTTLPEGVAQSLNVSEGKVRTATATLDANTGELLPGAEAAAETVAAAVPAPGAADAGVVYTAEPGNRLKAFEATTGAALLDAPLPEGDRAGVAVARGAVYAAVGDRLVAFRPTAAAGGQAAPSATPPVAAPAPTVVAAATRGVVPAVVEQGAQATLRNLDAAAHEIVSRDLGPDGRPLFRSAAPGGLGAATPILGTEHLLPGAYEYFCALHPEETGTLVIGQSE